MTTPNNLEIQLTNDYIKKLSKTSPIKALSELIWNAVDADANQVNLTLIPNENDEIEKIILKDNGHGLNYNFVNRDFGQLGDSHKVKTKFSPNGRIYHGKEGQGRFAAFVLGERVQWQSSYLKEVNKIFNFTLEGRKTSLKSLYISLETTSNQATCGVTVTIENLIYDAIDDFSDVSTLIDRLTELFSPYLIANPEITILVNGIKLNPKQFIKDQFTHNINLVKDNGTSLSAKIDFIVWNKGSYKNLYCSGLDFKTIIENKTKVNLRQFSHSAYLTSSVFDEIRNNNLIDTYELDKDYILLMHEVTNFFKNITRERLADEASIEIEKIKQSKIYPYKGTPKTEVEKAERQVFDICAYKINEYLPNFNSMTESSKKVTYRLLKEALEQNPTNLNKILTEVLNLPLEQQNELAELLDRTSLTSIINTTSLISNRLKFLNGLEEILYSTDYHKILKERSQLHKILLNELWIFGDQYQYGCDDISLKNVLKEHLKQLEREDIAAEIDFKSLKDLNDIPDIGLYRQFVHGSKDCFENLVIELKRPSCVIGRKEINQIESYAFAVEDNMYFDKTKTKWKFILLGNKLDDYATKRMDQKGRSYGLIYETDTIEVWVYLWSQIIQEVKGRHKYLQEQLELQVQSNEEGLNYLKEKYSDLLPNIETP